MSRPDVTHVPIDRYAWSEAPWPNLTAKRCLLIDPSRSSSADVLRDRGAGDVVVTDSAIESSRPFDIIVGIDVLVRSADPAGVMRTVRSSTHGLFVSIEPIDLTSTILRRGRSWASGDEPETRRVNGAWHWNTLIAGGFAPERKSRPFGLSVSPSTAGMMERCIARILTRSSGETYRGILGRAKG